MRLLINNKANVANTTVSSPNTSFPLEHMYADQLVLKTSFSSTLDVDLGSAQTIDTIAFAGTVTGSTFNVYAGSTPSVTNLIASFGQDDSTGKVINHLFLSSPETYRYWQISVYHPVGNQFANYFYLGEYLQLPNPEFGSVPELENTDEENVTNSGQVYTTEGIILKQQEFDFPYVNQAQRNEFEAWWYSSDRIHPHLFIQNEDDLITFPPFFAKIKKYRPKDRRLSQPFYEYKFNVEESK